MGLGDPIVKYFKGAPQLTVAAKKCPLNLVSKGGLNQSFTVKKRVSDFNRKNHMSVLRTIYLKFERNKHFVCITNGWICSLFTCYTEDCGLVLGFSIYGRRVCFLKIISMQCSSLDALMCEV